MTQLKPPGKGVIVSARCNRDKSPFGMRFEMREGVWTLHWSFRVGEGDSAGGNQTGLTLSGAIDIDELYRGCPYCQAKSFWLCGTCDCVACWDNVSAKVTCPKCGTAGVLEAGIKSLSGGPGR